MENDSLRHFKTGDAGEMIRRDTGYTPDLIEASVIAAKINEELERLLKDGYIPVWAKVDEEKGIGEITAPMFSPDELKELWRKYTNMTEDEMDRKINESGFYQE